MFAGRETSGAAYTRSATCGSHPEDPRIERLQYAASGCQSLCRCPPREESGSHRWKFPLPAAASQGYLHPESARHSRCQLASESRQGNKAKKKRPVAKRASRTRSIQSGPIQNIAPPEASPVVRTATIRRAREISPHPRSNSLPRNEKRSARDDSGSASTISTPSGAAPSFLLLGRQILPSIL